MLLSFTVGNFRSFKENKTFSLKAASIQEHKDFVREDNNFKLLPSVAIYGANSSGKSNLLSALGMMKKVLLSSVKTNPTEELKTDPFKLDELYLQKPTFFEVVFTIDEITYKYGFEYSPKKINREWLYTVKNDKDKVLFVRNDEGIGVDKDFPEGTKKEESTADNRLFLSLVAQLNGKVSLSIMKWFQDLRVTSGVKDDDFKEFSIKYLFAANKESEKAKEFLNGMDLGFSNIRKTETGIKKYVSTNTSGLDEILNLFPDEINNTIKLPTIETGHIVRKKDGSSNEAFFSNDEMESEGTKKIINMSGPIVDCLLNGGIIAVDEFDAKLHPLLTKKIIEIFNSPKSNPNNAQLLFATHDTNLLSNKIFRRDQIWFAEKNREDESTDIYPLSNIREQNGDKIRNDRVYEKDYINGKYGAIPFLRS